MRFVLFQKKKKFVLFSQFFATRVSILIDHRDGYKLLFWLSNLRDKFAMRERKKERERDNDRGRGREREREINN